MTMKEQTDSLRLPAFQQLLLVLLSFMIAAFGQPAWIGWLGLVSAVCGLALFFRVLLCYEGWLQRYVLATTWYAAVTFVQLSWAISHPYTYIYAVLILCCLLTGAQFGVVGILMTKERLMRRRFALAIASIWALMEWSRLFFLSGYTWNPLGLALTGSVYPMQTASLWGVFGLSFWVMFVNVLALRAWIFPFNWSPRVAFMAAALFPYLYGAGHILYHDHLRERPAASETLSALLVQPLFPVESVGAFSTPERAVFFVMDQWRQVLYLMKPYQGKSIDLIVLPEYLVPFGTYWPVYNLKLVKALFTSILGEDSLKHFPTPQNPDAVSIDTPEGPQWIVTNAYLIRSLANIFDAGIVTGLQDEGEGPDGEYHGYSAAFHFLPHCDDRFRYEKQVLLPMGEYIPFSFCRELAARYGIVSSFTPGLGAKVLNCPKARFGISICYEETFGNLMRHNRVQGAELLVNVTNDGWYPNSRVSQQHFDHSRLRTVEMGIPLVRAANTGVTGAVDSLGRIVGLLQEDDIPLTNSPGAVMVDVPLYNYFTLYTAVGDGFVIGLAMIALTFSTRMFFGRSKK